MDEIRDISDLGTFCSVFLVNVGEQVPEVPGLHVEPSFMGHGGRGSDGHRPCQWRSELTADFWISPRINSKHYY